MGKNVDYFVIGAQKAGTSWLYARLKELPEFGVLPVKQLHYFDRNPKYNSPNKLSKTRLVSRLLDVKWLTKAVAITLISFFTGNFKKAAWYFIWYFSNYNDTWYLSLFSKFKGIAGEITPSYSILEEKEIAQMAQLAPKAKILFILRNPVDRAWSHFRYNTRNTPKFNIEKVSTKHIMDFVHSEEQEVRNNYTETIKRYLNHFPKEQILIGFYDAIAQDPIAFLEEIVHFFGGDANKVSINCNVNALVNVSAHIAMPTPIKNALEEKYKDAIKELCTDYGSYAKYWLEQIENSDVKHSIEAYAPVVYL